LTRRSYLPARLSERREVATYEKTYVVDGEQYELYADSDTDEVAYELFDLAWPQGNGRAVTKDP
jgi:hypothetical protein